MASENIGTIAQAYVQIMPSTKGIKGQLADIMGSESESAGKSAGGTFAGAFGKASTALAGAAAAGFGAATAAAVSLSKAALKNYADYEQLSGGIETLFKSSSNTVMQYASEAYKTAGLSANKYMEAVTGFSASLISSLGGDTEKAARLANVAITDMSDNANKMGSDIQSIQNAYQGFARGQFQLLDNLKLGYGGTKAEMERLLADAEAISGVHYDVSSYADVVEALHVIQTEMGITGTTAAEAEKTISGSVDMVKASWSNLVTGIADENANLDKLIDNFVESMISAGENIIPRVESILEGLSKLIVEAADKLLPVVVDTIIQYLPTLVEAGVKLVVALTTGLINSIPQLLQAIPDILTAIINGLKAGWPGLEQAGMNLMEAVLRGLAVATFDFWAAIDDALDGAITSIVNYTSDLFEKVSAKAKPWFYESTQNVSSFVDGIELKISKLVNDVKGAVRSFLDFMHEMTVGKLEDFIQAVALKLQQLRDAISEFGNEAKAWGRDALLNFTDGLREKFPHLMKVMDDVSQGIANFIGFSEPSQGPLSNFHTFAPDMVALWNKGLRDNENAIQRQLVNSFTPRSASMSASLTQESRIWASQGGGLSAGQTTNNFSITVNGIEELDEIIRWYQGRRVEGRMA